MVCAAALGSELGECVDENAFRLPLGYGRSAGIAIVQYATKPTEEAPNEACVRLFC